MARKPVLCEEVGARALRNQTGGGRVGGFSLPVGEIFWQLKTSQHKKRLLPAYQKASSQKRFKWQTETEAGTPLQRTTKPGTWANHGH